MTRINLVYVEDLADQHLFAEWREIKMVPAALRRSLKTRNEADILSGVPRKFTLNNGHVSFFFDKMAFLHKRYHQLTEELKNRDYNISEHDADNIFFLSISEKFREDWDATPEDIAVSVERIVLRLKEKDGWYKFWGQPMPAQYFEELYKLQLANLANNTYTNSTGECYESR
jgi:deoxyribonuclease (pyrimidine dimer)